MASDNRSSSEVSVDAVYQQLYEEARRYRDRALGIAQWSTTIAFAILGGLVALASVANAVPVIHRFRTLLATVVLFQASLSIYFVWYYDRRFWDVRRILDRLEKNTREFRGWTLAPPHLYTLIIAVMVTLQVILIVSVGTVPGSQNGELDQTFTPESTRVEVNRTGHDSSRRTLDR